MRDSLPPSVDAAASSFGVIARIHCSTNRSQCISYGSASACIISLSAAWCPSPSPIAIVNSRLRATSISPMIAMFPSSACAEVPRHLHVVQQVLVAVARPHIPARRPRKSAVRAHRQRHRPLPRQQHPLARHLHAARRVPRAPAMQMRRQQRIALHPLQHTLVARRSSRSSAPPSGADRPPSPWSPCTAPAGPCPPPSPPARP